jgi:CheY-like chemotaxis protein
MNKETMLVVEDEDIMREALSDYFSDEGHKVDTAPDGDQALEKYDFKNYDVMIVDLKLPGRDGISVLKEIKTKNPEAKVIIITAYPSVDTESEAKQEGALHYLPKPFEMDYLETLIRQSYEVEIIPTPPVEEPVEEEKIIAPCIWMQAGVIKKRRCTLGYQCLGVCEFHAAMMKKENFRNDTRITPYLEKLVSQEGRYQCRYTMSGEISSRSCSQLYLCENCELHQTIQDEVDRQVALKEERRQKMKSGQQTQVTLKKTTERKDH